MRTLNYQGITYSLTFADLFPPLGPKDRQRLSESIRQFGVKVPVVISETNEVIDGANRLELAIEHGLTDVPFAIRPDHSELERRELAETLNLDRRHLSRDQIRALIADRLKSNPERSDRDIAAEVGSSDKTVASERQSLASTAEIPKLTSRRGRDGKLRRSACQDSKTKTARRLIRKNPDRADEDIADEVGCSLDLVATARRTLTALGILSYKAKKAKPKPSTKDMELKDALGVKVPANLRDLFGDPFFPTVPNEVCELLSRIISAKNKVKDKGGYFKWMPAHEVIRGLQAAEDGLKLAADILGNHSPYAVCPACGGEGKSPKDGDTVCHRHGYVPKPRYDELVADGTIQAKTITASQSAP